MGYPIRDIPYEISHMGYSIWDIPCGIDEAWALLIMDCKMQGSPVKGTPSRVYPWVYPWEYQWVYPWGIRYRVHPAWYTL